MFDCNTRGYVDKGTIIQPKGYKKTFIPKSYSKVDYGKCPCKGGKGSMYVNTTDIIANYMFGAEKSEHQYRVAKAKVEVKHKLTRNEKRRLGLI